MRDPARAVELRARAEAPRRAPRSPRRSPCPSSRGPRPDRRPALRSALQRLKHPSAAPLRSATDRFPRRGHEKNGSALRRNLVVPAHRYRIWRCMANTAEDEKRINTIRFLAVDAVQKANSGHPGMPLGAAATAYALWSRHMQFDPADPTWFNRDRFVLSAGHASALLYALLHLFGYDLTIDDLKAFRQLGSRTPGHPEYHHTAGVEVTTGPLGQGFANAVGLAIAQAQIAATYANGGRPVRSLHLRDGRRRRYDGRRRQRGGVAGRPPPAREADLPLRRQQDLARRSDLGDVHRRRRQALRRLRLARRSTSTKRTPTTSLRSTRRSPQRKSETNKPSIILVHSIDRLRVAARRHVRRARRTARRRQRHQDEGSSGLAGSSRRSSSPTTCAATSTSRKAAGAKAHAAWDARLYATGSAPTRIWPRSSNARATANCRPTCRGPRSTTENGSVAIARRRRHRDERDRQGAARTRRRLGRPRPLDQDLPQGLRRLPAGHVRRAQHALRRARARDGGSRSTASRCTAACCRSARPSSTFSTTASRRCGWPRSTRSACIYVFTHDSVFLGEDGPTHQPIEQLAMLRATPNVIDIRPADALETLEAWKFAVQPGNRADGDRALAPEAAVPRRSQRRGRAWRLRARRTGRHARRDPHRDAAPKSRSPVDAAKLLAGKGTKARVVSMPSLASLRTARRRLSRVGAAGRDQGARVDRSRRDDGLAQVRRRPRASRTESTISERRPRRRRSQKSTASPPNTSPTSQPACLAGV